MKLRADLILRQVGEDYVIVEPDQGMLDFSKVYTLNESAAWLWRELQGKDFNLNDVITLLLEQYDLGKLDQEQIKIDAQNLLKVFEKNNLLLKE